MDFPPVKTVRKQKTVRTAQHYIKNQVKKKKKKAADENIQSSLHFFPVQ